MKVIGTEFENADVIDESGAHIDSTGNFHTNMGNDNMDNKDSVRDNEYNKDDVDNGRDNLDTMDNEEENKDDHDGIEDDDLDEDNEDEIVDDDDLDDDDEVEVVNDDGIEEKEEREKDKEKTDCDEGKSEGEKKESGEDKIREMSSENVVMLKGVSKFYGSDKNQVRALDTVNLTIRTGSIIAIMGPSGSGKSTLINMIGSLDVPTHGEVIVDGINLENMTPRELTRYRCDKVGFVFQSFNLLPNLSALENVELPMEFSNQFREERHERAEKLLRSVRMSKRSDHFPTSLSGGEKQRIAIARALANDPSIILADEPTGNLDSKTGKRIIDLLKEISRNRSKTLIIVTHDKSVARMADNIITIRDGKITSVRDVDKEAQVRDIYKKLMIGKRLVRILQKEGYVKIGQIIKLSEKELVSIKGLKKKDASTIINKIRKYKRSAGKKVVDKESTGENCIHCNKHIPMEGALLCPFCGGKVKD